MVRVTEVLNGMLDNEFVGYIERNSKAKRKAVMDEAFRVGNILDALVQVDINDGGYLSPEGDLPVESCLRAWEKFKEDYPLFVPSVKTMQEELVDGDVVGHQDFYIEREDGWGIADLKCATGIRPKYWTQVAKYADMKRKMMSLGFPRFIAVLRLDKVSGLYEYKEITDVGFIKYECEVFNAYYVAYMHSKAVREQMRYSAEEEIL